MAVHKDDTLHQDIFDFNLSHQLTAFGKESQVCYLEYFLRADEVLVQGGNAVHDDCLERVGLRVDNTHDGELVVPQLQVRSEKANQHVVLSQHLHLLWPVFHLILDTL